MMRAEYYVRRRAKRARRMRTGSRGDRRPPPAPASGPEALRPEPCASGRVRLRPSASLSGVRPPRATQFAWLPGPRGGRRVPRDHRRRYAKCIQPGAAPGAGASVVRAVLTLPIHTLIKFDIAVDRCTFAAKAPYGLTATSSTAGPRLGRYSDVGGGRACCRVPASSETQTLPTLRPVRRSRRSFATVGSIP